jgi:hypothetical protein
MPKNQDKNIQLIALLNSRKLKILILRQSLVVLHFAETGIVDFCRKLNVPTYTCSVYNISAGSLFEQLSYVVLFEMRGAISKIYAA